MKLRNSRKRVFKRLFFPNSPRDWRIVLHLSTLPSDLFLLFLEKIAIILLLVSRIANLYSYNYYVICKNTFVRFFFIIHLSWCLLGASPCRGGGVGVVAKCRSKYLVE